MRQKIAIPKFSNEFKHGDYVEFRFVNEIETDLEITHDIFSIAGDELSEVGQEQAVWEIHRVRSNRTKKEMRLPAKLKEQDYIYRLSSSGPIARWQLGPGHYVLRVSSQDSLICEASFFIPWTEEQKEAEQLEQFLDQCKVPNAFRSFIVANEIQIMDKLTNFSKAEYGDEKSTPEFLKSTFEIAIREVNKSIGDSKKNAESSTLTDDEFLELICNAAVSALKAQNHTLDLLEKVFDLAKNRQYDDNELESLVALLIRGTDLEKYDEFGILQVIINNARNRQIDETRKKASPMAKVWEYEERNRQSDGFIADMEGVEHKLPDGPTDEFDENIQKLSAKKRRLITPHLVLSIHNDNTREYESMELPIDQTWTIGRQTSDELKKFGVWDRPFVDFENRRVILAGYFHNTFSKNLISIIPTYKHAEYMGLGRTVSLMNPSENYSISLSEKIKLDPGASYATPSHLFFYYAVTPDAIRLSDSQKRKLNLTSEQAAISYSIRIDVFFEEMNKGEIREVLVAKHDWVGKDPSKIYEKHIENHEALEIILISRQWDKPQMVY